MMLRQVRARTYARGAFLPLILCLVGSIVVSSPMSAQAPPRKPDCDLAERRYDNPFADHSGWYMRRYQWHAFYAVASTATAEGIHRLTHLPRWASAVTATVALGVIPHLRSGVFERRYPINPPDWGFDLFNRAAPLFVWYGLKGGNWQSETASGAAYVVGYASLACYASP